MFFDRTKTKEENDSDKHRYSHNKEVLQYVTAGVACASAIIGLALVTKKAIDEFT